jgi:hypothetical protein
MSARRDTIAGSGLGMESCDINASRDDKDGNFGLVFRMSDVMGQYAPAAGLHLPQ